MNTDLAALESRPAVRELAKLPQWVVWRWEEDGGRPTKPPRRARDGKPASHSDPRDWTSYDLAKRALLNGGGYTGLGFVFAKENRLTGVDLDDCRDPSTGEIAAWARRWVERFNTYTEVSPSGTGLKLYGRGWVPRCRKSDGIEVYDHARYFCVTGEHMEGAPVTLEEIGDALAELWQELPAGDPLDGAEGVTVDFDPSADVALIRDKLRELLGRSEKFRLAWSHARPEPKFRRKDGTADLTAYDLSLCTVAALFGWTDTELFLLIRAHREHHGRGAGSGRSGGGRITSATRSSSPALTPSGGTRRPPPRATAPQRTRTPTRRQLGTSWRPSASPA